MSCHSSTPEPEFDVPRIVNSTGKYYQLRFFMATVPWCGPQPNREFQMLKWWSTEQIMGTHSLPMNWHFTWLLHDMQSSMLVHDAFNAPELVHYTRPQCEQDLLQDQLQEQETETVAPDVAEQSLMPVMKSPNMQMLRASEQCERLPTIDEEPERVPNLPDAAVVQLGALPQRQRSRKPSVEIRSAVIAPDSGTSTVVADDECSATADANCSVTVTEPDAPTVIELGAATAKQYQMQNRWAGLAERAQPKTIKGQMTPAEVAFHLVDAH